MLNNSIKRQLLSWLMFPLISLFIIFTLIAYYITTSLTIALFDRQLLNIASLIAIRLNNSNLYNKIPAEFMNSLLKNPQDILLYKLYSIDGFYLAGEKDLPSFTHFDYKNPFLKSINFHGKKFRLVVFFPFTKLKNSNLLLEVALSTNESSYIAHRLFLLFIVPQLLLIVCSLIVVWLASVKSLESLYVTSSAIAKRSSTDLRPLSQEMVPQEIKPLVKALNDLFNRIESDNESRERFIANAAHHLRTPLALIKTYNDLALSYSSDEKINSALLNSQDGIEKMSHMVKQLLSLLTSESLNQKGFSRAEINLNELALNTVSKFIPLAISKNMDLGLEEKSGSLKIFGLAQSIITLMENLIHNSLTYCQSGAKITLILEENDEEVILSVDDDGPGIPIDQRDLVLERFYRIPKSSADGTGLGLSIVSEIAKAHQANVSINTGISGKGVKIAVRFKKKISVL